MGSGYYPALRALLLAHGCYLVRQGKGSHEMWYSPISGNSVTVSVTVTSRNTANAILKDAGIKRKV
ncbi:MAG: type II toxin-antitoxin system HicA family toxin [Rhodoferax sp.]|nr:type II toxin-antitoxin system HicA family toxin [Rhodoferax sp.]